MVRPKAVLFDLDDTLINRHEMFYLFSEEFVKDNFPGARGERYQEILDTLRALDDNDHGRRPELFHRLYSMVNEPMPPEKVLVDYWYAKLPECMVLMTGAYELLKRLKTLHIKMALVTNGASVFQNKKIDLAGIRKYFDAIIISGETDYKKPDMRIFTLALERLDVKAADTVLVGDNLINDIAGAQRAGIRDIWLNGFGYTDMQGVKPSAEITSLPELIEMARDW